MSWATHCANFWRRAGLVARACMHKEGLAFIALMVSLAGAIVLSFMLYGNLLYFRQKGATDQLFYLSCGMLAIIAITFWSSHRLLGSKQAIKAELWDMKLEMNQGGDDGAAGT